MIEAMIETAAQHQRIDDEVVGGDVDLRGHQAAEHHRRDHGHGVGLEEVRRHAGAVADVVADVVGDDRRVARIVLGDAGFHLADEVGADVGALGEDAAAQSREDRDQRSAEGQSHQRVQRRVLVAGELHHHHVVAGHAEQAQAHDQHAGDGAAAERDRKRGVQAVVRGLRRARVGAHRDVHADVAGGARQDRADQEADRGVPVERDAQRHEQDGADDADRRVLAVQVGLCAFLDGGSDLLHARVARALRQDPAHRDHTVDDRGHGTGQRDPKTVLNEHCFPLGLLLLEGREAPRKARDSSKPPRRKAIS